MFDFTTAIADSTPAPPPPTTLGAQGCSPTPTPRIARRALRTPAAP